MVAPYQAYNGGFSTRKLERENFVSHHSGTDLTELCALIALVPALALTLQWFCARQQHCIHRAVSCSWLQAFGQITWVVIPTILAVMSESTLWPLTLMLCVITMLLACWTIRQEHLLGLTKSLQRLAEQHRKSYITSVRGCTLVCTAICILAVDFQAFPRRYCKAEKFGHGLMDLGVGSFVFSSSISSRPGDQQSSLQTNFRSMQNNLLLLVLATPPSNTETSSAAGLARLFSVKSLDYQEHASEYGVHWNFFLTMAAVSTLTTIAPIPKPHSLAAGCLISVIHQLALSWGLIDIVHADKRGPQLWHLNKEGLLSVPGYWALSLLSTGLSRHLHPQLQAQNPGTNATRVFGRQAWLWLGRLLMVAAVLWGTLFIVLHWVQPVSRRACNLPYVVWSLTLNWTMLVLFVCGSLLSRVSAPLDLMSACSSNMLPLFLLANLTTGAVNLMLDSLLVPNMQAIGIVCFYMVLVCCIAFALHSNNIQLKVGSKQANGNVTKHA